MDSFENHQKHYREQHSTVGCKITHMIGVPMIAVSIPIMFFSWQIGLSLFVVGWIFQFIGHFVFEKNKPVLMKDPKNPFTYVSALVFVTQEWFRLLSGKRLVEQTKKAS
jgi:uncharacterized membrane protein YGL010W